MTRLAATKARQEFADIVNRAAYRGERTILHRHGKDVAAVVPVEDLELICRLEDRIDIEAAREALKEEGSIRWDEVKKGFGL